MFKSLKNKLLSVFFVFWLLMISLVIINGIYLNEKQKSNELIMIVQDIELLRSEDQNSISDFFLFDRSSEGFYSTKKSIRIAKHDSLFFNTKLAIKSLISSQDAVGFELESDLTHLYNELVNFDAIFNQIVNVVLHRGYKDNGLVGQLRFYAGKLEKYHEFPSYKLLTLRRYEKDYFLRGDKEAIKLFRKKSNEYKFSIDGDHRISSAIKDEITYCLEKYQDVFNEIVKYDMHLGLKNNDGFILLLNNSSQKITNHINSIARKSSGEMDKRTKSLKTSYVFVLMVVIITSIILSFVFASRITKPISILSERISLFIESRFRDSENFEYKTSDKELSNLIQNYFILKKEIIGLINRFEEEVKIRTLKIEKQKKKIESQKNKVESINSNLISSIKYAQRIQHALLPDKKQFEDIFLESFVFYKPKSIVSGDFYFLKSISNKNITIIAVGDCTGHGVPGALMSMLGISFLNEIVLKKENYKASQVLDALRVKILESLQKEDRNNNLNDGIDLGICVIFNETREMQFAGAKQNLVVADKNGISYIKGDRMPIGNYVVENKFTNHVIKLEKGKTFYIYTDGFPDQFDTENKRKFSRKRIEEIILKNVDLEMTEQKKHVKKAHTTWMGTNEQTDDVLFIGFKPKLT